VIEDNVENDGDTKIVGGSDELFEPGWTAIIFLNGKDIRRKINSLEKAIF